MEGLERPSCAKCHLRRIRAVIDVGFWVDTCGKMTRFSRYGHRGRDKRDFKIWTSGTTGQKAVLRLPSTSSSSQICLTKDAPLSSTASSSILLDRKKKEEKHWWLNVKEWKTFLEMGFLHCKSQPFFCPKVYSAKSSFKKHLLPKEQFFSLFSHVAIMNNIHFIGISSAKPATTSCIMNPFSSLFLTNKNLENFAKCVWLSTF